MNAAVTLTPLPAASAKNTQARNLAARIIAEVARYRRMAGPLGEHAVDCAHCLAPHLNKVQRAIDAGQPVTFVLPAFPGKSPNAAKVLSPLPDLAESRALEFINSLAERIREIYAPGGHIIICSDGRVFSDVVGMDESHVSAYQTEISRLIEDQKLRNLSTFNLDDLFAGLGFAQMRNVLMEQFGTSLESLREKVRRGDKQPFDREADDALRMYRGITRFLVEDASHPGQSMSRTAIQKECRVRAYEVIRRSNAWSALVEERFPDAVRLSIHPQICGSKKLGISLLESESWMTPWHGVALAAGDRLLLVKRAQAEAMGARLVHVDGRPSHFEMSEAPSAPFVEARA